MKTAMDVQAYSDAVQFVTNIIVGCVVILGLLGLLELVIIYCERRKKRNHKSYK